MDSLEGTSYKRKMNTSDSLVDCTNASRGVWLVKVPKYMSSLWQKAPSFSEAGRLTISTVAGAQPDIKFSLSDQMLQIKEGESNIIPKDHRFFISNIANQCLAVFSQDGDNGESSNGQNESGYKKLSIEGHVLQKGECRPLADKNYMHLKRQSILKARMPERQVKQLKKIVTTYKPVSDHKHNIEYEQKKKAEGKKARDDKDKVMEMLFEAFEKHQYYNIKDLERITRQPIPYLKEILKEICNYNSKNPHKSTWELKPEYRHYKSSETTE